MSAVRNVALFGRPIAGPGDGVDLFDRVVARFERAKDLDHAEQADVVRDEVRRVLRDDDALAETKIREARHALDHGGSVSASE